MSNFKFNYYIGKYNSFKYKELINQSFKIYRCFSEDYYRYIICGYNVFHEFFHIIFKEYNLLDKLYSDEVCRALNIFHEEEFANKFAISLWIEFADKRIIEKFKYCILKFIDENKDGLCDISSYTNYYKALVNLSSQTLTLNSDFSNSYNEKICGVRYDLFQAYSILCALNDNCSVQSICSKLNLKLNFDTVQEKINETLFIGGYEEQVKKILEFIIDVFSKSGYSVPDIKIFFLENKINQIEPVKI